MRSLLGVLFLAGGASVVWACGMASRGPDDFGPDAATGQDGNVVPIDTEAGAMPPRLVVVNALTEAKGAFGGVLICTGVAKSLPLPRTIMPLTNYPGIPVGGGADLGGTFSGTMTLEVFDAAAVTLGKECGSLSSVPHASLPVDVLPNGTTVLALVTDTSKPKNVGVRKIHWDGDAPSKPDLVEAHFVNLSAASGKVELTVAGALVSRLLADTEVSSRFEIETKSDPELVATHESGAVAQRLQSVQYASDPTSTPAAFFGVRAPFLFALVGDPAVVFDSNAPAQELTGRELHLIAVPYGDGVR